MQLQAVLCDGYIYNTVFKMKPKLYIDSWPPPQRESLDACLLCNVSTSVPSHAQQM
jgi:hypothetical protein